MPKQLAALVTEVTAAVHSVDEEALSMREAGLLGQYDEMMYARRALNEQRVECLQPFERAQRVVFSRGGAAPAAGAPVWSAALLSPLLAFGSSRCCMDRPGPGPAMDRPGPVYNRPGDLHLLRPPCRAEP